MGEDTPQETNRVALNADVTDQFGLLVANVNYSNRPSDKAMRAPQVQIYLAQGNVQPRFGGDQVVVKPDAMVCVCCPAPDPETGPAATRSGHDHPATGEF